MMMPIRALDTYSDPPFPLLCFFLLPEVCGSDFLCFFVYIPWFAGLNQLFSHHLHPPCHAAPAFCSKGLSLLHAVHSRCSWLCFLTSIGLDHPTPGFYGLSDARWNVYWVWLCSLREVLPEFLCIDVLLGMSDAAFALLSMFLFSAMS